MSLVVDLKPESLMLFKTKLSDGRYFSVTPYANLVSNEYIIAIEADPIYVHSVPVLLRQKILKIQLFSVHENTYLKTAINAVDTKKIGDLIASTLLNKYNLLFAQYDPAL